MEGRDNRDVFDSVLCDELLAEVLCRVFEPLDRKNIPLVCKRWKRVQRLAKSRLVLDVPGDEKCTSTFLASIPSLLAQYPFIKFLSIKAKWRVASELHVRPMVTAVASSCKHLTEFHFTAGPLNVSVVEELARGCPYLYCLELLQPLSAAYLPVLCKLSHLQELCLRGHHHSALWAKEGQGCGDNVPTNSFQFQGSLKIIRLILINIRSSMTCDLTWLWQSCQHIQKLKLSNCDVLGDTITNASIAQAFPSLEEVKLLACRRVAGQVFTLAARHTPGLKSLTVHDGADTEGLGIVLKNCRGLQLLDLQLPLDLNREDLMTIAQNGRCLRSLRLHSCWMATGTDIQSLARTITSNLEELVLIRCRAISQDPGTLSSIGQSLPNLKRIDLSDNDSLADKELVGMLAATCEQVQHLRLYKCPQLTDMLLGFIGFKCISLESLDIRHCEGFSVNAIHNFLINCRQLRMLAVEANKLSCDAKKLCSFKRIALIHTSSDKL